jgi:hypothetical protein
MKSKVPHRGSLTDREIEETVQNIFDEHNYGRRLMEWRLPSECEAT